MQRPTTSTPPAPEPRPLLRPTRRVGVGIDTSPYGHYAAFLRDDLQPAAAELQFAESAAGYAQLRQRLEHIAQRQGPVHFLIRLDAAGQYADNLLHFLHSLGTAAAGTLPAAATAHVDDAHVAAIMGFLRLAAGLGCGLLIGLERQWRRA